MTTAPEESAVTTLVTFSQKFPRTSKEQERHDKPWRKVKPRRISRSQMRRFIADTLDGLDIAACGFWACPGPDKPTAAMATCNTCYTIKRLRVMLGWLQGEA